MSLIVTWTEPFSLEGEDISYVVFISNRKSRVVQEVYVHSTRYVFNELESFGAVRNCAEYDFTVFSKNLYSLSLNGVSGRRIIPTGI